MSDTERSPIQTTAIKLQVPADFARYDGISDPQAFIRLEEWKRQVFTVLTDLRAQIAERDALSLHEKAQIISAVAPLESEAPWASGNTSQLAREILRPYAAPETSLLEHILSRHVKPIFQANPHPSLNASTGRILPRSAGGPTAQLDHYEGQSWKSLPGAPHLVSWCVRHSDSLAYEKLWHLIIPPVMILLDDYEASYKLHGIQIVSNMLRNVPADLLRRTGVDGLLFSSLKTCLTYLHNPETPSLIRTTIPTLTSLVLLTTSVGSEKQFDQLCSILGDGIIGSVWVYATRESDAIEASVDALPGIVQALGIGTVRYLKAIVPQLVFALLPAPENGATKRFQLSSLRALSVIIEACAPRMDKWKNTILEGVLRCWVTLTDAGIEDDQGRALRRGLEEVCDRLRDACPSVANVEYAQLLQVDENMFGPLVKRSGRDD